MQIHNLIRQSVARGVVLLFGLAAHSILGQSDVGTLRVAIRDKATGEVMPAMICITNVVDNTWRVPPDGRKPAGFLRNVDFILYWRAIPVSPG